MADGGRKPKHPALKKAEGNPGGRPIPKVPAHDKLNTDPPPWLDALAVTVWERVVDAVNPALFARWDEDLLGGYCQHMSNAIAASKVVQKKGLTDDRGNKRPEVNIFRDSLHNARLIASELGLTPAARAKGILPHEQEEESGDWDFLE